MEDGRDAGASNESSNSTLNATFNLDVYRCGSNDSIPNQTLQDSVNLTRGPPLSWAIPICGYGMPSLLVVTIIANTFIVIVLAQRHMRTPTNVVLLGMAVSDMMTLLLPTPWMFYVYTLGNYDRPLGPSSVCQAFNAMHEVLPNAFHTTSVWLTVLLAVQRYIYVCHPTVAVSWCTMPRVTKTICAILLIAFGHQIPRFFDFDYEDALIEIDGHYYCICLKKPSYFLTNVIPLQIYFITYFAFKAIFINMLPCALLVVLNVLLFKAMREAQQKRMKLLQENRKSECKKLRDTNSTTLMLIVVVTAFLVVEVPLGVTLFLHLLKNTIGLDWVEYSALNITLLLTNFFLIVSYPLNFAIYCGMSKQFRKTFKDIFVTGVLSKKESSGRSAANGPSTRTNETVL